VGGRPAEFRVIAQKKGKTAVDIEINLNRLPNIWAGAQDKGKALSTGAADSRPKGG